MGMNQRKKTKTGFLDLEGFVFQFLRQKLTNSIYTKKFLYEFYWSLPEFFKSQNRVRYLLQNINLINKNKVSFINIGANDGLSGDPLGEFIFKYKWKGIMIEPVPYVFDRLKRVYKNRPGVILEKSAISMTNGKKNFWHLERTKKLNSGYDQLGSFDKKMVLDNMKIWNFSEGKIIRSVVNCLTLNKLIQKHKIIKTDVISIDAEGYDYQIIKQLNFKKIAPKLIVFEHGHLNNKDKEKCFSFLRKNGYSVENDDDGVTGIALKD